MKFLIKNNAVITLLLFVMLLVSGFMIIRLESKAASLQSRLDEHHAQLKINSDDLDNLSSFMRRVGGNVIYIDESMVQVGTEKSRLTFRGNEFNLAMRSGNLVLQLSEQDKLIQLKNGDSKIKLNQDNIEIETKGNITVKASDEIKFGYDKTEDRLYLINKESKLFVGKLRSEGGKDIYGALMMSKSHGQFQVREDGIIAGVPTQEGTYYLKLDSKKKYVELKKGDSKVRFEGDDIETESKGNITVKASDEIKFGYDKTEDRLYLINKESKLFVGKLRNESGKDIYGALMMSKSHGQFQVREDGIIAGVPTQEGTYFLKMDSKKKYVELNKGDSKVRFKGDNINIEANGDINITSKNGKVNINGKN